MGLAYDDLKGKYDKFLSDYQRDKPYVLSLSERINLAKDKSRIREFEEMFNKLPKENREQFIHSKNQSTTKNLGYEM